MKVFCSGKLTMSKMKVSMETKPLGEISVFEQMFREKFITVSFILTVVRVLIRVFDFTSPLPALMSERALLISF